MNALPPNAHGVVPRVDISLFEVCFAAAEAQKDFLSAPFTNKHFSAFPLPPAGTPSRYVPVKLINVPVLSITVVEQQLRSFWKTFGEVVELAPHTVKGFSLLTNRWDLVMKIPDDGKPLSATPLFDILGFKVMASWPGSEKACPRCKQAGHDSRSCPRRPAPKKTQKKRSAPSTAPAGSSTTTKTSTSLPLPTPAVPQITQAVTPPAAAAADVDMGEASSSNSDAFPFELTSEQASQLNALSAEEWTQHCKNVRANHPRIQPAIDRFLSLPLDDIIRVFKAEVQRLTSAATPTTVSTPAPTPTPTTSTSTANPPPPPSFGPAPPPSFVANKKGTRAPRTIDEVADDMMSVEEALALVDSSASTSSTPPPPARSTRRSKK
jgi:hypothetical protein